MQQVRVCEVSTYPFRTTHVVIHRCPCTTVVFSGSINLPPSLRVSPISIASSTRYHSAPSRSRNSRTESAPSTRSKPISDPAPITDPSRQNSIPPGRSTRHSSAHHRIELRIIPRKVQHRVAHHHIGKPIHIGHRLHRRHLEITRRNAWRELPRHPPHNGYSLGIPIHPKDFVPLAQQVDQVPPTAAARIHHAHSRSNIPTQELIEYIDIDPPKLGLKTHLVSH